MTPRVAVALSCWLTFHTLAGQGLPPPSLEFEIQELAISKARQFLNSDKAADRAWGIYYTAKYHLTELLPEILKFLPPSQGLARDASSDSFYRAALDALIQLDATPSPDILNGIYRSYPDVGIILFAKSPKQNQQVLLSLFQQPQSEIYWLAIGNLLTEAKAPGFAAALMKQMEQINAIVVVSEAGQLGGVGGSDGSGIPSLHVPDRFPPIAIYELTGHPARGGIVIAPGPRPIYYERWVIQPGQERQWASPKRLLDFHFGDMGDHYRFEYLAALMGERLGQVKFDSKPQRAIKWDSPNRYINEVTKISRNALEKYRDLAKRLVEKNLLTETEAAGLDPRVHLKVIDFRKDKSIGLPEIHLPGVVEEK